MDIRTCADVDGEVEELDVALNTVCGIEEEEPMGISSINPTVLHITRRSKRKSTNKSNPFQCSFCEKKFKFKYQLCKHKKSIHNAKNESKQQILCVEDGCAESFAALNDLQAHLKSEHGIENIDDKDIKMKSKQAFRKSMNEFSPFECPICEKKLKNAFQLWKHKRNVHKVKMGNKQQMLCVEDGCKESFAILNDLRTHLKSVHGFLNIDDKKQIKMDSRQEFNKWLKKEESETNTAFRISRGEKKFKTYSVITYQCNRSGVYKPRGCGLKQLKAQGSRKLGYHCTAQITVKYFNDHVEVGYYYQHYQHDFRLGHIPISKSVKQDIANKLALGMNATRILNDIKDSAQIDNVKREHLITKKDILNIRNTYRVPATVLGTTFGNDMQSLGAWVSKTKEKSILLFKEQGCEHQLLATNDFMLVIMNDLQKAMLKSYGTERICIDSTFGVTENGFELVSLFVMNEFEEGFPVAFCCCSTVDFESMTVFLNCIKAEIGDVDAKIFMSDDTNIFFSAWGNVFESVDTLLLCAWHVCQAWQEHLKLIVISEKREKVYRVLKSLLHEVDEDVFKQRLQILVEDLEEDVDTQSFATYFKHYYLHRTEAWAYCYRNDVNINTNKHVEAFHKAIEHIYLEARKVNSVDKCVDDLMSFLIDKKVDRLLKSHKGKITNKISNSLKRHNMSKTLVPKKIGDDHWEVASSENDDIHQVLKNPSHYCNIGCVILCRFCKCCISAYRCTCTDYTNLHNLCKHIHAALSLNREKEEMYTGPLFISALDVPTTSEASKVTTASEASKVTTTSEASRVTTTENTHSLDSVKVKLSELLTKCESKATLSDTMYEPILQHLNDIEKILQMDPICEEVELLNKEPASKSLLPQKRSYPTKQTEKNNKLRVILPANVSQKPRVTVLYLVPPPAKK